MHNGNKFAPATDYEMGVVLVLAGVIISICVCFSIYMSMYV